MKKIVSLLLMVMLLMVSMVSVVSAERYGFDGEKRITEGFDTPKKIVRIKTYIEGIGWTGPFYDGDVAGTTGQSKRMEALSINIYDGTRIRYRVNVEGLGWSSWAENGEIVGTMGENRAIVGIQMKTNKEGSPIEYSAHVANIGWMPVIKDYNLTGGNMKDRIEAIRVHVISSKNKDWFNDF